MVLTSSWSAFEGVPRTFVAFDEYSLLIDASACDQTKRCRLWMLTMGP